MKTITTEKLYFRARTAMGYIFMLPAFIVVNLFLMVIAGTLGAVHFVFKLKGENPAMLYREDISGFWEDIL